MGRSLGHGVSRFTVDCAPGWGCLLMPVAAAGRGHGGSHAGGWAVGCRQKLACTRRLVCRGEVARACMHARTRSSWVQALCEEGVTRVGIGLALVGFALEGVGQQSASRRDNRPREIGWAWGLAGLG